MAARLPAADRVCVVLLTGLGDVVNGLPLVNALRDDRPSRHITWVVEPMPSAILRHHPSVDEVVVYRKRLGARGVRALERDLRGRDFDLTLNLNYYFKSVWPTLLSRAPDRVGFDWARSRDGVWFAANHHVAPRPRGHTVDMFLEFADYLGVPHGPPEWRISFTEEERREQAAFFAEQERPLVLIPPTSAIAPKDWFSDRWARVVDAIEHDFGLRAVLIGGAGERETRIAREVGERASAKPLWAMGDPIRRMAWMIEGAALVIAPDTGPLHIARALDTPVVGLYGHTNPWRAGPYRKYHDLLIDRYTDPGEAPDPTRFDSKDGRMEQITVNDVLSRVERARQLYPRTATGSASRD